jgi:hypothetical protein
MDGEDPRPTAVILSEAKDLGSCPCVAGKKQLPGFFAPQIGAQNDSAFLCLCAEVLAAPYVSGSSGTPNVDNR